MQPDLRKKLIDFVGEAKDRCVEFDIAANTVAYDRSRLKVHRNITEITGGEEFVRGYLVSRLVNELGYRAENIEIEREYAAGRRQNGLLPRIDVILNDSRNDAFYFIEVKDPDKFESDKKYIEGQLFNLAALHMASGSAKEVRYLVYYTVEEVDGKLRDKAIVIDRQKYKTFQDWKTAGELTISNELAPKYNKPKKEPLVKNGKRDLATAYSSLQLNSLADNLHDVLWGGGGTGDTEVFSSLVNIILAKIQDEYDTADGQEYKFQVMQHGDELQKPEEVFQSINELYLKALKDQLSKKGDLSQQSVVNQEKFSLTKLMFAVNQLEGFSLIDGKNSLHGKDLLGDFFERIQRSGYKQTKGQFFTPNNIVRFMTYALNLDLMSIELLNENRSLPYIIDSACGSGTFLIESMKTVTESVKRKNNHLLKASRSVGQRYDELFMPDNREHKWAREYIYGIEHNFELATASKVNMILHGDGSSHIFHVDALKPFRFFDINQSGENLLKRTKASLDYNNKEVNGEFDVVMSNPPFSVNLDNDTKQFLSNEFLFGMKGNSENLFIERCWQLLREGGRMAVILPESIFDTTENMYIRLYLYKFFNLVAIVSLPQVTFEPYTQTKTSVVFAQKKNAKELAAWNKAWEEHSHAFILLATKIANYLKVYLEGKDPSRLRSIKSDTDEAVRANVQAILLRDLTASEQSMSIEELIRANQKHLTNSLKIDSDIQSVFGRVNCRWVFTMVAGQLDRSIFMAEAAQVGYKRTKRGENPQRNDLFDLEIAPDVLPLTEVNAAYQTEIEELQQQIAALQITIADLSAKPIRNAPEATELARKERKVTVLAERITRLTAEQQLVETTHPTYYAASGKLLEQYAQRTDQDLLKLFQHEGMKRWASRRVLIRTADQRTILDFLRQEQVWA